MRTTRLFAQSAAVLLCGAMCTGAWAGIFSRQLTSPGDFSGGIFDRTQLSEATGGVSLVSSTNSVPFLWIPIPDLGVVSKVDPRTGAELARYQMGPQSSPWTPNAVASDERGNAYVACAADGGGKIVKILASGASRSVLRTPECTSFDYNGDKRADVLAWGRDTRVSVVASLSSKPSSLARSEDGLLWVGLSGEQSVVAMDADKQTVLKTVLIDGAPDTMIAGPRGSLWVVCGDTGKLLAIDTMLGAVTRTCKIGACTPRSAYADGAGYIWLGTDQGLVCVNASDGAYVTHRLPDGARLAGVTMDKNGNIWGACPSKNELVCFSGDDVSVSKSVAVGHGPNSVSVDSDGYVWSLNEADGTATRVDPRAGKCVATVSTAGAPFSSTPFAASVLKNGVSPTGSWRMLFDSKIPGSAWGSLAWACVAAGGSLRVEVRSANAPEEIQSQPFVEVSNGFDFSVPNGEFLEVKATFAGGGNSTSVLKGLCVQGGNLPPDVSLATPSTQRILKQDHTYETVAITGVSDPEGDPVRIEITRITQDEPQTPLCADDKGPDAQGVGTSEAKLKGECDPGTPEKPGNGRVYTVTFRATDALGASSTGNVKVTVPPTFKWDAKAVDDGQKYDSTKDPQKEKDSKALVASL